MKEQDSMTGENDIVLIHFEETPAVFARVESILPDHKKDWYHVKLLLLQVPLQVVTWILRDVYINGETFTMGGKRMRLEKIVCPTDSADADAQEDTTGDAEKNPQNDASPSKQGNVISLFDPKKK